jgi:hypothetical protein
MITIEVKYNFIKKSIILSDPNLLKPKVISNAKVDRLGSKTAPIEADFVILKI